MKKKLTHSFRDPSAWKLNAPKPTARTQSSRMRWLRDVIGNRAYDLTAREVDLAVATLTAR